LGLELSVEVSYPIDEAAGVAMIFLWGQISGFVFVLISAALEQDLSKEAKAKEVENGG